jgi:hypothetical protein
MRGGKKIRVDNVGTYKAPRLRIPTKPSFVLVGVSGLKYSGTGIERIIRSKRKFVDVWLSKVARNVLGFCEAYPQQLA